jgi:peptide/nickel transport system substrate-binding protein
LRIWLEVEPESLHPLLDPDTESLRITEDTVFETLLRRQADGGPGIYMPGLAESWRIRPDGQELRVVLRQGVKFHDGRAFSAVDAQQSIDLARSSRVKTPHLRAALADVVSVEMLSARELRITLARPNAYVLRALAEIPMLPGDREPDPRLRVPVGTGPYRFATWEKGRRILLVRSDAYAGPSPAIEEIEFLVEPDAARALTRAKRGELDVLPRLIPEHYPAEASSPGIAGIFDPLRLRPARFQYVLVNAARPPFSDARVRQAAALLLDRHKIARELSAALSRPVAGPVWPGGPGDGASPEAPPLDPVHAAELLGQAGYRDVDGDGVRESGEQKLAISFLVLGDPRGEAERDLVVSGLRRAGFVVELRPGEPAVLLNRLKSADFDAALLEWRGRVDEDLATLFHTGGALNWGHFSSVAVDAVLDSIHLAWEPAARAPKLAELAALLASEWPILPLCAPEPYGLIHKRVKGVHVDDGWFALRALSLEPSR